jgi:hypothetical protein
MLEAESVVWGSFVVSEKIAKHSKSYSHGEFVRQCFVAVVDILCPNNSNGMHAISLSRRTVTRRVSELAADVDQNLRDRASKFEEFSSAIHESTAVRYSVSAWG